MGSIGKAFHIHLVFNKIAYQIHEKSSWEGHAAFWFSWVHNNQQAESNEEVIWGARWRSQDEKSNAKPKCHKVVLQAHWSYEERAWGVAVQFPIKQSWVVR